MRDDKRSGAISASVKLTVLAHEVAAVAPAAVSKDVYGFLRVDYRRLGLQLRTYEDWVNKGHLASTLDAAL
jgi:hypothetical protein